MALLGVKREKRPAIIALGLFGAALICGDGAITPAISVLSALEGLTIAAPGVGPYVVPMAVTILIALFAIQSQGTVRIGRAFGPVMAAWFASIALLGIWGITKHPAVLLGLDPRYAISYGAFSMTRQAIQLGWFPRLKITQTSAEGYGQIYVGPVNWMLMVVTIALTIGFGKSDNLAAAYGIAVSAVSRSRPWLQCRP